MNVAGYDIEKDVERWAKPFKVWASSGFTRGIGGFSEEKFPIGKTRLPSLVFFDTAIASIGEGEPSEDELERRLDYIERVGFELRKVQGKSIRKHFIMAITGLLSDVAIAFSVLVGIGFMFQEKLEFNPISISLLLITGACLLIGRHFAKKTYADAYKVFQSATKHPMPWQAETKQ